MSETIFAGPALALGPLVGGQESKQGNPWSDPGTEYQGATIPDIRYYPANKDGMSSGRMPSFMNHTYLVVSDNAPQAVATAGIAALANVTNGTPMTLVSVQAAGANANNPTAAPAIPIQPVTGGAIVNTFALDFGFSTLGVTAGSPNCTLPAAVGTENYFPGQSLVIGGVGSAGLTVPLLCRVSSIVTPGLGGTIAVSPTPTGTLANAPVGSGNLYGTYPVQGRRCNGGAKPARDACAVSVNHRCGGWHRRRLRHPRLRRAVAADGGADHGWCWCGDCVRPEDLEVHRVGDAAVHRRAQLLGRLGRHVWLPHAVRLLGIREHLLQRRLRGFLDRLAGWREDDPGDQDHG